MVPSKTPKRPTISNLQYTFLHDIRNFKVVLEREGETMDSTIKDTKKTNDLPMNAIDSSLIEVLHGRSFTRRACVSIAELPVLTAHNKKIFKRKKNNYGQSLHI